VIIECYIVEATKFTSGMLNLTFFYGNLDAKLANCPENANRRWGQTPSCVRNSGQCLKRVYFAKDMVS
jgi:hypothetical protein